MAGVVRNVLYRFSVSALIGAVVAGGVIYFTNDRVVKGYRNDVSTLMEQQTAAADSLTVLMAGLSDRIAASDAVRAEEYTALAERLDAIEVRLENVERTLGVVEYSVNGMPEGTATNAEIAAMQETLAGLQDEIRALSVELKSPEAPVEEQ